MGVGVRYLSLFSGIEAATQAWKPLGWEVVAFSEIEPFPCAVLDHHYPNTPNLGDITKITESQIKKLGKIDIIVFGSPCQDLSVAGKRKGLDGERSGLFRSAITVIGWARKHCGARLVLWENVPGALSSNRGADFAEVIRLLSGAKVEHGKWQTSGVAIGKKGLAEWRVLDAKYFGVPQRRRRIFLITDFGNWTNRQPILFEHKGVSGDIKARYKQRKETAPLAGTLTANGGGTTRPARNANELDFCVPYREGGFGQFVEGEVGTLKASRGVLGGGSETFSIAGNIINRSDNAGGNGNGFDGSGESYTQTTTDIHAVSTGGVVRRLTPKECERLQGFKDGYTKIPYRNKSQEECPDTPRYKALGNSMAVPVMRWIGERIQQEVLL